MGNVTIRELRNQGGQVIERVTAGEALTITRDGQPVAELRPLARPTTSLAVLLERWANLPAVDPAALRIDIDATLDPSL